MYDAKDLATDGYESDSDFKLTNAFGGDVFIKPADLSKSGDEGAFIIEYNNLSTEACVTVLTGDWGSGQGSGLVGITAYDKGTGEPSWESAGGTNLPTFYVGTTNSQNVASPGAHGTGEGAGVSTPVPVAKAIDWCKGSVVA